MISFLDVVGPEPTIVTESNSLVIPITIVSLLVVLGIVITIVLIKNKKRK